MQSSGKTYNWVLNTIVRSWKATLAARPNPSPRTMAKMKVMIQISCKKRRQQAHWSVRKYNVVGLELEKTQVSRAKGAAWKLLSGSREQSA